MLVRRWYSYKQMELIHMDCTDLSLEYFTHAEQFVLAEGGPVTIGSHRYIICKNCHRIIRVTGPFKGWHLCV